MKKIVVKNNWSEKVKIEKINKSVIYKERSNSAEENDKSDKATTMM